MVVGLGFGGRKYCNCCDEEGSRVLKTDEEGEQEEEESSVVLWWSKTLSKFGEKAMSLMYHSSSISSMGFKAQREPKSSPPLFSTKPVVGVFGFEFLGAHEAEFSSSLSSIQAPLDIMASF